LTFEETALFLNLLLAGVVRGRPGSSFFDQLIKFNELLNFPNIRGNPSFSVFEEIVYRISLLQFLEVEPSYTKTSHQKMSAIVAKELFFLFKPY